MMKKLAIFDFDGTLFNSVDDVFECFNKALTIHNFPTLTYDEFVVRLGGNIDEITSLVLKDKNTPENIELIKNTYEKLYSASDKPNTLPYPEISLVLKNLQDKNIILSINSNRKTDSIKYFTDKFLPEINFEIIEGHNPRNPSKPHPFGVNEIISKTKVKLDEAIYIGDSKTDIKTAENVGIDCIIVKWGYGSKEDYIKDSIERPSEILNYFK